jgi:hypothetical protein
MKKTGKHTYHDDSNHKHYGCVGESMNISGQNEENQQAKSLDEPRKHNSMSWLGFILPARMDGFYVNQSFFLHRNDYSLELQNKLGGNNE